LFKDIADNRPQSIKADRIS